MVIRLVVSGITPRARLVVRLVVNYLLCVRLVVRFVVDRVEPSGRRLCLH